MKIDREDLYRRVWSTPVSKLAVELNISDVGLAKACRKAGIPLPPVGYWTKVAHGKSVPKPVLPASDKNTVELDARRVRIAKASAPNKALQAVEIPVPTQVPARLPPFTAATKAQLLARNFETAISHGPAVFDCRVAAGSVERTVCLLAAIESNLPSIGAKLQPGNKRLEVELEGQRLEFRVLELTRRSEVVVKNKYYKGSLSKDYKYEFRGLLNIEVLTYYEGRKKWTDGKRAPLTEKVGEFLQGLISAAHAVRQRNEEIEARNRKWAEESRRREEREARKMALQAFQQRLVDESNAAEQSRRILDYLERLREELSSSGNECPEGGLMWLGLAENLAAGIDPLPRRVQRLQSGKGLEPYPGCFNEYLGSNQDHH
jgi:hypothetical protein